MKIGGPFWAQTKNRINYVWEVLIGGTEDCVEAVAASLNRLLLGKPSW